MLVMRKGSLPNIIRTVPVRGTMTSSEALAPASAYDVEPAGGNRQVIVALRPTGHS